MQVQELHQGIGLGPGRPVPRWRLTAWLFDYRLFRAWENSPWWAFWKACHLHFLQRRTLIYPPAKRAELRAAQERAAAAYRSKLNQQDR